MKVLQYEGQRVFNDDEISRKLLKGACQRLFS